MTLRKTFFRDATALGLGLALTLMLETSHANAIFVMTCYDTYRKRNEIANMHAPSENKTNENTKQNTEKLK